MTAHTFPFATVAGGLPGGDNRSLGRFGLRGEVPFGGPTACKEYPVALPGRPRCGGSPARSSRSPWTRCTPTTPRWSSTWERRLGGRVTYHQVKDIDYVRDTMVVDVRHQMGSPVTERGFDGRPVLAVQR